jgi:hypothetical protein
MEEKKVKCWHEILWDYDGILYHEYTDGTKKNIHCWVEFDLYKQRQEYTPAYQFKDWKLVAYSRNKAEWLTINDDLNKWENLLWWTRWEDWRQELIFRPIKSLTIPHIKAILVEWHTNNREYIKAFTDRLTSVININN